MIYNAVFINFLIQELLNPFTMLLYLPFLYIGPGIGIGTIIIVLIVLLIVLISIFLILWIPIKRFIRKIIKLFAK